MFAAAIAAALLGLATPAVVAERGLHVLVAGPVVAHEVRYGAAERQAATLFVREKAGRAPLIVYVHGGGWIAGTPKAGAGGMQAEHWTGLGYAYATAGYRLAPGATAEQQMQDLAQAVAALRRAKGVDPGRIVLIGHSSGAQMAALLATDPHWLKDAGVPFETVRAAVLLDPSGLDLPPLLASRGDPTVEHYFRPTFGDNPARQSALSPVTQTEPPNAPAWLILADVNNGFAQAQGSELAAGLIGAGAQVETATIPGTTHLRLNDEIGRRLDKATAEIDAFLGRVFPQMQRVRRR
ncbi:alpha/beta hydrolase [Sphingomonas tabacisoli]|uniref:Alpha/beta hydrolase n=1 Tax=Sphingomonas tabacisoli TaxID=2249466 RepID=A0ABW4I5U3_9SPHN